jgi:YggT family protein
MLLLYYYGWVVIANVVISWLTAFNVLNTHNKFVYNVLDFTYKLTDPILNRIRRFIPNFGAFDISPIILLLLIQVLKRVMIEYIYPLT